MVAWQLGTMGFAYKQWVGPFYPAGMQPRQYLAHYSSRFNSVEIDSTFYGPPTPAQVARWTAVTPDTFTFCLKTPRQITHDLKLVEAQPAMRDFLTLIEPLDQKLGPVLIQLPPDMSHDWFNPLRHFLAGLPAGFRYAVEFRHRSWDTPGTAVLLRDHQAAWVSADYIHLPPAVRRTTDFLYLRFIGPHGKHATKDRELEDKTAVLTDWVGRLQPHLAKVGAVYGYFNNDYAGYSPATCRRFKRIIGLDDPETRPYRQGRLF